MIPIRSFKDGVGRQAPSKRLPTEAQDLENVLVTLENSAEKRPGTEFIQCFDGASPTLHGDLELPVGADLYHYWFELTPEETYLITVDYSGTGDLVFVSKLIPSTGELNKVTTIAGNVSLKDYVRYGNDIHTAQEALRIIALGPQLMVLNTKVKTGASSDANGKLFGLDGIATAIDDDLGKAVTYESAIYTDPESVATVWVKGRAYAGGQEVYVPADGPTGKVWKAKQDVTSADNSSAPSANLTHWEDSGRTLDRIPVKEFKYPDSSKAYLGQAVNDISELKLPPTAADLVAHNGAEVMLAALYPDELGEGENDRGTGDGGKGKVFYLENGYGGAEPGYYITRSRTEKPYMMPVRTPEGGSLLSPDRMPVRVLAADGGATWTLESSGWTARVSGDVETNPGPKVWQEYRQTAISSMALFRNRLWFGASDTVFSSSTNDFGNFFIQDPALLVDTDPIDVLLSSNQYTPVTTLTPFESYMFINTSAGTQFSLQGSENQITPYTAEVSSASFYSTAPLTEPVLMGSQIYFFDDRRMYIFFNDRQVSVQKAIEVSQHCPNYLPKVYGAIATAPAYDSVFMTDADNPKDVYLYTNRYRGDQVVQNAFFKYKFTHDVVSIYPQEDTVYLLIEDGAGRLALKKMAFQESDTTALYLDDVNRINADGSNALYNPNTNLTTLTFVGSSDSGNDLVMVGNSDLARDDWGTILTIDSASYDEPSGSWTVDVVGDHSDVGKELIFGKNYTMTIDLSPVFQRDQKNNVIDGVLSLRSMMTRHFNTGAYRVETTIRGRDRVSNSYTPMEMDLLDGLDPLALESRAVKGEMMSKILGFSDETEIRIVSDTPNPVNITQIELKGIFKNTASSFVQ